MRLRMFIAFFFIRRSARLFFLTLDLLYSTSRPPSYPQYNSLVYMQIRISNVAVQVCRQQDRFLSPSLFLLILLTIIGSVLVSIPSAPIVNRINTRRPASLKSRQLVAQPVPPFLVCVPGSRGLSPRLSSNLRSLEHNR